MLLAHSIVFFMSGEIFKWEEGDLPDLARVRICYGRDFVALSSYLGFLALDDRKSYQFLRLRDSDGHPFKGNRLNLDG